MSLGSDLSTAVKIFISYAREDRDWKDALARQLSSLRRQGIITNWHDSEISPSGEWQLLIKKHLHLSDIIFLLISPDFVASDYCYCVEMTQALDRHERGETRVVPILLRPTDFKGLPFAKLQYLPANGRALTLWKNKDAAFLNIIEGIKKVIEEIFTRLLSEPAPSGTGVSGLPPAWWKVPYRRNPLFTGRASLLAQLHATFQSNESVGTSIQTLNGLGGIGKTQIALEYTYRYAGAYQAIFWIAADPQGDMLSDFVTIAHFLDLPEQNEPDQSLIVAAIKRWLQQHERWLLLFDNVEDVTAVDALIPETGKGHILITTRSQAIGNIAIPHEVDPMDVQEGAWFLLRRAKIIPQDAPVEQARGPEGDTAQEISQLLDGLPLALDQAGAYIEETRRNLSDYLDLYQKRQVTLLSRRGKFSNDHPDSVTTTFSLAFENIEHAHPQAAELLRFCAFFHPDALPEEIIIEGATRFDPAFQSLASDPLELDAAIEALLDYSLIKRNPSTRTISVHRLVQDVLKSGLSEDQQRHWAESAIQAVSRMFPDGEPASWSLCQRYLPHARVCIQLIEQWQIDFDDAIQLLNKIGYYLYNRAQYSEAQVCYEQALALVPKEARDRVEAPILSNLGDLHLTLAQYTQAEQYFTKALTIRERTLEQNHPDIAQNLNDLAGVYHHQGMYGQAELLYQQALTMQEQSLGLEHPIIARTLNNLALLNDNQEKYTQAEELHRRALAIREKALGPKHVETMKSLVNLARVYRLQKRYAEAEPLFVRALTIREEVLGPEHPDTAITLNGLGLLYNLQEKYTEAEPLLMRALTIRAGTIGSGHPRNVPTLKALAIIYLYQEKYIEAEQLLRRALQIQETTSWIAFTDLVASFRELAHIYESQEKYAEADSLYQLVIAIHKRVLGLEHPDVTTALDEYASFLRRIKKEE
jgi:tetratricopeptide (TPR) repeat protein